MIEVEVTIDTHGRVEVHVHGMKGPRCLELKAVLEEALGPSMAETLTSEYYAQVETAQGLTLKPKG